MGTRAEAGSGLWESVVGRSFVEALNDGLARAGSATLRARATVARAREARELPDPFTAAVMAAFGAALPGALAPEEQRDVALRSALLRRGRQVLAEALSTAGGSPRRHADDGADELSPEHETVALTLLMECAVLMVLEGREFEGSTTRPADLIRALGCSARRKQNPAAPG